MKRRGFTLIELMLVLVIIGILATLIVPRLTGGSKEARLAAAKVAVHSSLPTALDLFELHIGRFPSTSEGLKALVDNVGGWDEWKGPYLKRLSRDPWGEEFIYRSPGNSGSDYDLVSKGPDREENTDDDIINWQTEEDL